MRQHYTQLFRREREFKIDRVLPSRRAKKPCPVTFAFSSQQEIKVLIRNLGHRNLAAIFRPLQAHTAVPRYELELPGGYASPHSHRHGNPSNHLECPPI